MSNGNEGEFMLSLSMAFPISLDITNIFGKVMEINSPTKRQKLCNSSLPSIITTRSYSYFVLKLLLTRTRALIYK